QQAPPSRNRRGRVGVGILAERTAQTAQRDGGAEHDGEFGDLTAPAWVEDENRHQDGGADPRQRLAVECDEARDTHACTAAARSRVSRSAAATPPVARASIRALPTTTPSACRAAAVACAGVPIPNPTTTGTRVIARM